MDIEYLSLYGYVRNTPSDTSACRTPAESRWEYLTTGKEYIEPHKTRYNNGTRGKNGNPLSVRMGRVMEKDLKKRPSDRQLPEAPKKTLTGP